MSRWKPPGSKKKAAATTGGAGRVFSCFMIILCILGIMYMLFVGLINK